MALVILSLVLLFSSAIFGYDDKFSQLNVDTLMANDELLMSYLNCFVDKGPCTAPFAEEVKKIIPDIIREACAKCNDVQKQRVRKLVNAIYDKKSDIALAIQMKYDPNHEYEPKFLEFLSSNN